MEDFWSLNNYFFLFSYVFISIKWLVTHDTWLLTPGSGQSPLRKEMDLREFILLLQLLAIKLLQKESFFFYCVITICRIFKHENLIVCYNVGQMDQKEFILLLQLVAIKLLQCKKRFISLLSCKEFVVLPNMK